MTRHDFQNKDEDEVLILLQRATPEQLLKLLNSMQGKESK